MCDAVSDCILSTYSKDKFKTIMFCHKYDYYSKHVGASQVYGKPGVYFGLEMRVPSCIYMLFKGLEQEELVVHLKGDALLLFQLFV